MKSSVRFLYLILTAAMVIHCGVEDPPPIENEEEVITDVILNFTPTDGEETISVIALDPDGEGPLDLQISENILFERGEEYELSIELSNSLAGVIITEEVAEEGEEHQFFFEWTTGLFDDPGGNGNMDNPGDPINYQDYDEFSLPIGLSTSWVTGNEAISGTFRIVLKHQPGIKSGSSGVKTGDTDIDLQWDIRIK